MTAVAPLAVTFYAREGCHLCEDALALLERVALELGLPVELTLVNLTAEPELEPAYGQRIPVIAAPGHAELAAPISEPEVRALLLSLAGR